MPRPVIIAIVGASGSGKTFLTKHLRDEFDVPVIVSTTTRPMREGEIEGEDYFFIQNTRRYERADMLTHTRFGKYEYFSMRGQLPPSGFCTYVVDENGIRNLKNTAGEQYAVCTVLVRCDPAKLRERGIDPERIDRDLSRQQVDYSLIDLIVSNDGTPEEFKRNINAIYQIIRQWEPLL